MKHLNHSKPNPLMKFVRVTNSTWIQVSKDIPDDVARTEFLKKIELSKPDHGYRELSRSVVLNTE